MTLGDINLALAVLGECRHMIGKEGLGGLPPQRHLAPSDRETPSFGST